MVKNVPPIKEFEAINEYCKNTKCYECIAGKFKEPEKGKIDDFHYVCALKGLQPQDWNMKELKANYKDAIISNLESMSQTAGLRADKKATIEAAINIIGENK